VHFVPELGRAGDDVKQRPHAAAVANACCRQRRLHDERVPVLGTRHPQLAASRVADVLTEVFCVGSFDRLARGLLCPVQGINVSQYVREAALIRSVLDELDSAEEALHSAHDLLAIAREVRSLAEVDPPGPPRANAGRSRSANATHRQDG
jgi:hypothetical protein